MSEINNAALEVIAEAVARAMASSSGQYDQTFTGKITAFSGGTTYTVQHNDHIRVAKAINGITYSVNERVYITAPCGDFDRMFILGRVPA